jgi:RNA polymerase sigma factor (TIGR02999 family)
MDSPAGEVTVLLRAWADGDQKAEERLFELVLPELHKVAARLMRQESPDHSLQPTALLHEAYFRLVAAHERQWQNRSQFFAIAGRIMRRLLVDHARGRPKAHKIAIEGLEEVLRGRDDKVELAVAIDELLHEIETTHPDWCSIVELKFFLGFTDEEAAAALGLPLRTLQRRFGDARRWLYEKLELHSCREKPTTTS